MQSTKEVNQAMTQDNEKMNKLLKMAEDYTHKILKSSLMMRDDETDEKKRVTNVKKGYVSGKKDPRGSKRKHNRLIDDGGEHVKKNQYFYG